MRVLTRVVWRASTGRLGPADLDPFYTSKVTFMYESICLAIRIFSSKQGEVVLAKRVPLLEFHTELENSYKARDFALPS